MGVCEGQESWPPASPAEQDPKRRGVGWDHPPPWMGLQGRCPALTSRDGQRSAPTEGDFLEPQRPRGPHLGARPQDTGYHPSRPKAFRKHQLWVHCSGLETGLVLR